MGHNWSIQIKEQGKSMNTQHINCLTTNEEKGFVFGGDTEGYLYTFKISDLGLLKKIKITDGTLQALTFENNILAGLSNDHSIFIGSIDENGFTKTDSYNLRNIVTDDYLPMHSVSQALSIHPKNKQLVTKSANGSLVYLDFEKGYLRPEGYLRVFEEREIITAKYILDGSKILVGSAGGDIALIENKKIIYIWKFKEINETIHWFHEVEKFEVIVATDAMRLVSINLKDFTSKVGPLISRDDLEHVTMLKDGDLVASSFDRNLYRIDKNNLKTKNIIYKAPFKIRWVNSLKNSCDMIIQIRNGTIQRVSSKNGKLKASWKKTQQCIWTSTNMSNQIYFAGEGNTLWKWDKFNKFTNFFKLNSSEEFYSKRICSINNKLIVGRTNGDIHIIDNSLKEYIISENKSAIRDLCSHPSLPYLYVAREDGTVTKYDYNTKDLLNSRKFDLPIWSLSISPNGSSLAVAQRMELIHILKSDDLSSITSGPARLPKRSKWINSNELLVVNSSSINKITYYQDEWKMDEAFFFGGENTIEDFIVDSFKKYLVAITYNKKVILFDYKSGEKLDELYNGTDLLKGIISHYDNDYQYFTTFGRCGYLKTYSIHNNQIFPVSTLNVQGKL